ncbi:MAG: hypothetical protein A4E53_01538 [Pelotomaculum sp. PtaB.Bin104]|nr:MAG: hypothetical protein A4E53_01538 [Pelotomaculum sp. PtaB.Bin104]
MDLEGALSGGLHARAAADNFKVEAAGSEAKHIIDLLQAEAQGRLVILPCKIGDIVRVNTETLPYNYLHPLDNCKDFAKCEVIGFVKTKQQVLMKLSALYPSRMNRRGYLRYSVSAIGKTVFIDSK